MGLSGCLALSPWIPNLEENRGRKNVCVVVRTAAAAERSPDPGQAVRNRDPVPTPFWASAEAGRDTNFSGPRAALVDSWCGGWGNSDPAQGTPDPPECNLKTLCIFLDSARLGFLRAGSTRHPPLCFSLGGQTR